MVHAGPPLPKENCVAKARTSAGCCSGMSGETYEKKTAEWPGPGVLLLCVCFLVAGFGAALLRGPVPAGEVGVRLVPSPAAEEPVQP